MLDAENFNFSQPGAQFPRRGGSQTVGAFAYQAIAGFSVPLPWLRGLDVTTEHRFVGLVDPLEAVSEERQSPVPGVRPAVGNAKFGNVLR